MTRKAKRRWWWRCLRIVLAIWLAFAIMRVMKRPTALLVGLCVALIVLGVAVEATQSQ
jgi:hypothetical protein